MNTPNKITLSRICLIPIFMYFLLSQVLFADIIALFVFVVAAATDGIDGYLARKYNQVTTFGKFLDPLADKLLVIAAIVCLVQMQLIGSWIAMILITRELMITSFRIVAMNKDVAMAANVWGKVKTIFQIIAVSLIIGTNSILLPLFGPDAVLFTIPYIESLGNYILYVAVGLTLISGYVYLKANWSVINYKV